MPVNSLVVTDGFYEWKKLVPNGKEKQPYAIHMTDDAQMVMAGLWAKWKSPGGEEISSCTILTCGSNTVMGELLRQSRSAKRRGTLSHAHRSLAPNSRQIDACSPLGVRLSFMRPAETLLRTFEIFGPGEHASYCDQAAPFGMAVAEVS